MQLKAFSFPGKVGFTLMTALFFFFFLIAFQVIFTSIVNSSKRSNIVDSLMVVKDDQRSLGSTYFATIYDGRLKKALVKG